jgi:hypothetical protein
MWTLDFVGARSGTTHQISKHQLTHYLRNGEASKPDIERITSPHFRQLQRVLVVLLHDYWLRKYLLHLIAVRLLKEATAPANVLIYRAPDWLEVVDLDLCAGGKGHHDSVKSRQRHQKQLLFAQQCGPQQVDAIHEGIISCCYFSVSTVIPTF